MIQIYGIVRFSLNFKQNRPTCAIAGRTARCRCKFRYIVN